MRPRLLVLLAAVVVAGCGQGDDAPSPKTRQESDKLQTIRQKTGGDWNKLTPEDRDYIVKDLAQGSEPTARMLLGGPQRGTPGRPGKP